MVCSACNTPVPHAASQCPACGTATPVGDATQLMDNWNAGETALATVAGAGWSQAPGSPASSGSRTLAPGTILGDRYEILALLGEGGMGAVLKARDREVDRLVALKVIRPEFVDSHDILQRFRQELVLARQVTHANVVRIYDLGVADGIRFISMEYIEGRELGDILQESGKLAPRSAGGIMLQVCRGLAAAHKEGVIHRDLKPQNIMVDAQGRAAIMDFGIANSVAALEVPVDTGSLELDAGPINLTRVGALLGTPRYMSPEQAKREKVDHRSDLFTFGLVLYELVSGEVPCEGNNLSELLHHRATVAIRPLRASEPGTPERLNRIVMRCLAIDPADRYQSGEEIVRDLEIWLGIRKAAPSALQRAVAVGIFMTLAAAGVAGYLTRRPAPQQPKAAVKLLVADFDNSTGNPLLDGTLEPMIGTELEGASFVTAYNRGQAHKVAGQLSGSTRLNEQTARLVAAREGLGVVVSGSISRSGKRYSMSVRAVDAANGKSISQQSVTAGSPEELPRLTGKIAAALRKALGDVTPVGTQIAAAETFSSKSLRASQQYALAQELQWKGKWNDALAAYQQSIQFDPDLGRAYAGLAATLANLGRRQDAEAMYKLAMSKIDRMSDREKYRTRGGYYLLERDYFKASEQFKALVKQYPADTAGIANLALAYFYQRNMSAALEEGRRAVAIYPNNLLQLNNVGLFAMYAGDFATAVQESRRLLEMNDSFEKAYVCLGLSLLGEGKVQEAIEAYHKLAGLGPSGVSEAAVGLADAAWYRGDMDGALTELEKGIQPDLAAQDAARAAAKWAALGQIWAVKNNRAKAVAAADDAVKGGQDENVLYPAALIYLETGGEKKALALASKLGQRFEAEPQAYGKLIEAEVRIKHGEYHDAVKTFQAAQALADTWLGRFGLGRAYLAAHAFTEADTELDACLQRRGEATAVFLDDEPSYHYLPSVYYYLGRAREGLQSRGALEAYQTFVKIKDKGSSDPMVTDARHRVLQLEKMAAGTPGQ